MTCRLLSLSSEAMWPELLRLLENRDNPDQTVETDVVHVLYKGRIVKTAGPELALELEEKGYDWIKKEMGD